MIKRKTPREVEIEIKSILALVCLDLIHIAFECYQTYNNHNNNNGQTPNVQVLVLAAVGVALRYVHIASDLQ